MIAFTVNLLVANSELDLNLEKGLLNENDSNSPVLESLPTPKIASKAPITGVPVFIALNVVCCHSTETLKLTT